MPCSLGLVRLPSAARALRNKGLSSVYPHLRGGWPSHSAQLHTRCQRTPFGSSGEVGLHMDETDGPAQTEHSDLIR